jgi:bifunctional oligoribonuclease and PAP phosphatase NrnA
VTYRTPPSRTADVAAVLRALEDAQKVILTTHVNADGDGTGCEIALASWLQERGKEVWIINPTGFPLNFEFLREEGMRVVDAASPEAGAVAGDADFAIVVDTGEIKRIGRVAPLIADLPRAVIDHHPPGDEPIPGVSFRDAAACAAGELVYDLILAGGGPLTTAAAQGLYVAILTDTGSFRHSNTSAACLRLAADLVEKGVDPETMHRKVYGDVPLRRLQLLRHALEALGMDDSGTVAWISVPEEEFQRLGGNAEDLEGLVDYPRTLVGVEVGLLFRTLRDGATKISFRSNGAVDVNRVAGQFGGGGHVRASGAVVGRPVEEVRNEVIAAVREAVREAVPDAMKRNASGERAYSDA